MFQIENTPGAIVVRVSCSIDFAVKAEFVEVLRLACSNASTQLIVSLEECPYMDCSGLSALVGVRNAATVPISVVVRRDSFLAKLFSLAGLAKRLNVTPSIEATVAA